MQPNYLELIAEATKLVQKSYPGAILFTATGSPASGVARKAEDLTNWNYKAQPPGTAPTVQVTYANGKFGPITKVGRWVGVEYKPLPQGKLQLPATINVLNKNGIQEFSSVSFGTPVVPDAQPMNWFCVNHQTQGVSADTGQFYPNLFPCSAGGVAGREA